MDTPEQVDAGRLLLARLLADPARAVAAASNDHDALVFLEEQRWPSGVQCVHCGERRALSLLKGRNAGRRRRTCGACRGQFSPITATPFAGDRAAPRAIVMTLGLYGGLRGMDLAREVSRLTGVSVRSSARVALLVEDQLRRHGLPPQGRRGLGRVLAFAAAVSVTAGLAVAGLWGAAEAAGPLTETWRSGGRLEGVVTERHALESWGAYVARHSAMVREAKRRCPPDRSDR